MNQKAWKQGNHKRNPPMGRDNKTRIFMTRFSRKFFLFLVCIFYSAGSVGNTKRRLINKDNLALAKALGRYKAHKGGGGGRGRGTVFRDGKGTVATIDELPMHRYEFE